MKVNYYQDEEGKLVFVFPRETKIDFEFVEQEQKAETPDLIVFKGYQELYRLNRKTKTAEQVLRIKGEILDYNSDYVFYITSAMEKHFCECKNIHTGDTYTIKFDFEVKKGRVGNLYAVFYGSSPKEFALYDVKHKYIKLQNIAEDLFVSEDFLNGKTPFYYTKNSAKIEYKRQYLDICSIFNENPSARYCAGYVDGYHSKVLFVPKAGRDLLFSSEPEEDLQIYKASWLITEKTQYISDIDNFEGCIKFYRLTVNGLELANILKLDKKFCYETHLTSCGSKFVICEGKYKEDEACKNYERIFLYDVEEREIEYENTYYANKVLDLKNDLDKKFMKNLLLYAHGFQDYFYHIVEKETCTYLIPSKEYTEWQKLRRQKKAVKEILKAFKRPEQLDRLRLKV